MENSWFSLTPGSGLSTSSVYLSLGILTKDEWMTLIHRTIFPLLSRCKWHREVGRNSKRNQCCEPLIRDLLARSEKGINNLFLLCSHPVEDSLELSMLLHSLGETSGTRHHMHPWELLKSGNKEERESLKWKTLLWGKVAYRQLSTRMLASSCRFRLRWRLGCQEWVCSNLQWGWICLTWEK